MNSRLRRDRLLGRKLVIAMVGLPARGKSYIAQKVARYLDWLGFATRVFNVGGYRRSQVGARQPASFFDPGNDEGTAARDRAAREALDDACAYLHAGAVAAIYDATNTTRARRAVIAERCDREGFDLVFVESICDDPALIDRNVRATKLGSPDYVGVDEEEAVRDFRNRISLYERAYEPVGETESEDGLSFIKLVDLGRDVRLHRINGHLPGRIVYYLLNSHDSHDDRRPIYLTRHGQSVYNLRDRIGGDAPLTARGEAYSRALAAHFLENPPPDVPRVWTSSLARAMETARPLPWSAIVWRALDEIDAGICDGMTYDEIRRSMPDEWTARAIDKFGYRYPRGESYVDVIERLEPVILELERQRSPVVVVAHNAVIRVLYGYFMDRAPEVVPSLDVPLHTLVELQPSVAGACERRYPLGPALTDGRTGG